MQNKNQLSKIVEGSEKLFNLLFGKISGLNDTFRFSGIEKIKDQSVAVHSYWTAIIAGTLYRIEEKYCNYFQVDSLSMRKVDLAKLYECCLFHDVEEVLTGDILHTFKHSNESEKFITELNILLEKVIENNIFNKIPVGENFYEIWNLSHDEKLLYNYFVKMGDYLQMLQYCVSEINLGNKKFEKIKERCLTLLQNKNNNMKERELENKLFFIPSIIDFFINNIDINLKEKEINE